MEKQPRRYNAEYWKKHLGQDGYKERLKKQADATRRWREKYPERDKASQRRKYLQDRESRIAYAVKYKTEHPEKARIWARNYTLRKKYGFEQEDYTKLFAAQKGQCAICNCIQVDPLCVDHNHKTGKVRGLLCHACNLGIGKFNDDPELIERAILYLEEFRA